MNKLIEWLLRTTSDGATYLQVVILSVLLIFLMYILISTALSIAKNIKDDENVYDQKEVRSYDI